MRRTFVSLASLALLGPATAALVACTGDDNSIPPAADAGGADSAADATVPPGDGGADTSTPPTEAGGSDSAADAADASADAALGPFLLLSYSFASYAKTEYAAFDLTQGKSLGHIQYAQYGTNMSTALGPWVLDQYGDRVLKMSPTQPWIATSSWSVAAPGKEAGSTLNSDAISVAETATTAYVALYASNLVDVLATGSPADGGAPSAAIDLSPLVEAGDGDGLVEATAAYYDSGKKYVWLVLGNIDKNNVDPSGYFYICKAGLTSTVVALDTTTGQLVPGLKYTLSGVSPYSVRYDAPNHRLLAVSAGCNQPPDAGVDASVGPMFGRLVEQVDLTTGTSTVLLSANDQGFPGSLEYVDGTHAFVSFGGVAYAWNPTSTTLGAPVANAPDAFVWDGKGRLLGPKSAYLGDGGFAGVSVVAVDPLDGGVTTIGTNPVSQPDPSGSWEGIDLWPHP